MLSGDTAGSAAERMRDFFWLPDGRMIYSLAEPPPNDTSCNYWEAVIDAGTGKSIRKLRRLTAWAGFWVEGMSASADGRRLTQKRSYFQDSVDLAEVDSSGTRISAVRRLTVSEDQAFPVGWTADSRAVIFAGRRNGQFGVFRQFLDADVADRIETGLGDANSPQVSPDGSWILYHTAPKEADITAPSQLMRVSMTGGPPQLVFALGEVFSGECCTVSCSLSPATICAVAELAGKQLVFTSFEPVKGRGRMLTKFDIDPSAAYAWNLSPDGTRIAIVTRSSDRIHILPFDGLAQREIVVRGWKDLTSAVWAVDGKGLFVGANVVGGRALLYVDLKAKPSVLWQQKEGGTFVPLWAVTSPDGRHLAIHASTMNSNMWMVENF
jgi:hypothetical protein